MADGRGGYRKPSGGARAKGVGANSQRTDANQPVRVANVGDSEDLVHGDRQKLEAAQRIAPLGRARAPRVAPAQGQGTPAGGAPGMLPDHLFGLPTQRPTEPVTHGSSVGPGAGPEVLAPEEPEDDREVVLRFLAAQPNAPQAIVDMLDDMRAERIQPAAMPEMAMPQTAEQPVPQAPIDEPMEDDFTIPAADETTLEGVGPDPTDASAAPSEAPPEVPV
jgi:hypothetical protein